MSPVTKDGAGRPRSREVFLRACRGEPVEHAPVWIMRQAGRYLPEYRALKARYDFLTLCKTPELATEVTVQPVERLGVDAAILFSDILVPIEPMGVGLRFDPGPILDRPISTEEAVAGLRPVDVYESLGYVADAIRMIREELRRETPLIGFAGAPFTVAAYLAEEREKGKTKGTFDTIVRMIFEAPDLADRLIDRLTTVTADYLTLQIRGGADAIQIFDSWAGILDRERFERYALAPVQEVISRLPRQRGPVIYFVLNGGHVLDLIAQSGADVIGVDWRTPLNVARGVVVGGAGAVGGAGGGAGGSAVGGATRRAADGMAGGMAGGADAVGGADGGFISGVPAAGVRRRPTALQGNLDPRALFASPERIREEVRRVLAAGWSGAADRPGQAGSGAAAGSPTLGHVFNLGHGILPDTPVEHAQALVRAVHAISEEMYREER